MSTILILEDDNQIRTAYTYALVKAGHTVYEAPDAAVAAALIRQHKPQILILDMLLPGTSGLEMLRNEQIKQQYPQMHIIGFSNIDNPNIIKEAQGLGVDQYLQKVDVTPSKLVEIINGQSSQAATAPAE